MTVTLQLEDEAVEVKDAPKLLVEWSSPWHEFVTSVRPAFSRSEARLAGEAPFGLVPIRIILPSYLLEALFIFAVIILQVKISEMRPYVAPRFSSHDVIYYSGDELPRTEDLGGAETGSTGRAGGDEAHHRTQTIKIARGGSLVPRVVDAPNLKLPASKDAVANLLAVNPDAGPPPLEGVRSARTTPNLSTAIVAPAPNVIRDYTRNGVAMEAVIAPAPSVSRDQLALAPNLSARVIPPAPSASRDNVLVAPALAPSVIPPAPNAARDRSRTTPTLNPSVVAPAPSVNPQSSRSTPALAANVIPPAPGVASRELSSAPVQMTTVAVVPPPVSAPERASTRTSKVTLPAPSVIAPPPSADISRDLHRLASGSVPDSSRAVVPPPPTQAGSGSLMSSLMGKIFGPSEVVPPPPSVSSSASGTATGRSLSANAVPPPPSVASDAGGNPGTSRRGAGAALGTNVIAPPPSAGMASGYGTRSVASSTAPALGPASVVPPPPSLSGAGGGSGNVGGGIGGPNGTLLAKSVVPPPPSLAGGSSTQGGGTGQRGAGLGGHFDAGSAVAPPTSGGSGPNAGTVISSQPGAKVGLPMTGGTGSLALSPTGGDQPGLGGTGGGTGIGRGPGSGSGLSGEGGGTGKTGAGRGASTDARGGISPSAGPGGAGNATSGNPPVPGVSVNGGTTSVTLPSFGSDPSAVSPTAARHSSLKQSQSLDVDIVATANSGGAFEPYKNLLHGEKHTIYPDTSSSLGLAVMEYADESATGHGTISPPQALRTGLPEGLPRTRMVVICTLDAAGNLKNIRVLEPGSADMTAKVLAALRSWKFRPALRGNQPIEVTSILGFAVDTNDRF